MYRGKCGKSNADDASYCTHCGAPLVPPDGAGTHRPSPAFAAAPIPVAAVAADGTSFDAEAWAAVIGPRNTDYYLSRFETQFRTGQAARWHWPAFFVTLYWLLYRKLWGWAALYFFAPYVLAGFAAAFVAAVATKGGRTAALIWVCYVAATWVCPPLFANALYYARCRRILERNRTAVSRERFLAQVEANGGTSNAAAIIVTILGVVFLVGVLSAIAIPAYQDYTRRAKTAEVIRRGMDLAGEIGSFYEKNRRLPDHADYLSMSRIEHRYLSGYRVNETNGSVALDVKFDRSSAPAGTVLLIPSAEPDGRLAWACRSGPSFRKFTPRSCRDE